MEEGVKRSDSLPVKRSDSLPHTMMLQKELLFREDVYFHPYKPTIHDFHTYRALIHRHKRIVSQRRQNEIISRKRQPKGGNDPTNLFRSINALVYLLSLSGFGYQVYDTCNTYFKYETIASLTTSFLLMSPFVLDTLTSWISI
jgi:hypothetical protein